MTWNLMTFVAERVVTFDTARSGRYPKLDSRPSLLCQLYLYIYLLLGIWVSESEVINPISAAGIFRNVVTAGIATRHRPQKG